MRVDIGNAFASVATPGVPRSTLDELDARVGTAHDRIQSGRADEEFGYTALDLPATVDIDAIDDAVTHLTEYTTLFVVGIGGSALGATTLCTALGDGLDVRVLDNIDPTHLRDQVASTDLTDAGMHVVSRSGTTTETLANFLILRDAFTDAGIDWTDRTLITTGAEGPLRRLADAHDVPTLPAPDGVPGRFAVLSTVGLPAAALADVDLRTLIDGAHEQLDVLTGSLYDCPAYAYGAMAYALDQRGATINALLPYAERLAPFTEWLAQLWAESLGKDGNGQTPARAMGVTDQHSQLQLYRAGPNNKLVTVITPTNRDDYPIPDPQLPELDYLADTTLGTVMDAERRATEASLAAADRPSIRVELDAIDAADMGALLYGFEAATILAGELYDVETFTQPAVEWGKRATRDLLTGDTDLSTVGDSFRIE